MLDILHKNIALNGLEEKLNRGETRWRWGVLRGFADFDEYRTNNFGATSLSMGLRIAARSRSSPLDDLRPDSTLTCSRSMSRAPRWKCSTALRKQRATVGPTHHHPGGYSSVVVEDVAGPMGLPLPTSGYTVGNAPRRQLPLPAVIPESLSTSSGSIRARGETPHPHPISPRASSAGKTLHPLHEVRVWTTSDLRSQIPTPPGVDLVEAVDRTRLPAMQSDLLRLAISGIRRLLLRPQERPGDVVPRIPVL